ncbi:Variant-specific surface protein, partial [Giardia duodenalis]
VVYDWSSVVFYPSLSLPHSVVLLCEPRCMLLCSPTCIQCYESVPRAGACYWTLLSGSACTSCESNSGGITGVRGCASCAVSTGNTGLVLCYLMKDSTTGGSDPNLSSGAIAGISVAVIAVVGDLVDSDRNAGTCIADASDRERCRCAAWPAEVGLRRPPVQIRAYASYRQAAERWVR